MARKPVLKLENGVEEVIRRVIEMGFEEEQVRIAMTVTNCCEPNDIVEWLIAHVSAEQDKSSDTERSNLVDQEHEEKDITSTASEVSSERPSSSDDSFLHAASWTKQEEWEIKVRQKNVEKWKREKEEERRHRALVEEQVRLDSIERAVKHSGRQNVRDNENRLSMGSLVFTTETYSKSRNHEEGDPVDGWKFDRLNEQRTPHPSSPCAISVRLPSGEREVLHVLTDTKLWRIHCFAKSQLPLGVDISLSQPFPRRVFGADELTMTLSDLGLCPSAALTVTVNSNER